MNLTSQFESACVILGAGLGSRLNPLTLRMPKPLVPVANRPIIEHVLQSVSRAGFSEALVNTHYRSEDLVRYFREGNSLDIEVISRRERKLTGPAGALHIFDDLLTSYRQILVLSGDGLHDIDLAEFINAHSHSTAMLSVVVKEVSNPGRYGVALLDDEFRLRGFVEKPKLSREEKAYVSCGIYCLNTELVSQIPTGRVFDFGAHLIPELVSSGDVSCFPTSAYWRDVGDLDDLLQGNRDASSGNVRLELPGRDVGGGIHVEQGASIAPDAIIKGPAVIGRNVRIGSASSLIGPVVVGADSVVGRGAYLNDCLVFPRTQIGDDDVVMGGLLWTPSRTS